MYPQTVITELPAILHSFVIGWMKCLGLMSGSGLAFFVAQAASEEHWIIKAAGAITGWALAVIMLYVLMRTIKVLFEEMKQMQKEHKEAITEKDRIIAELHETAVAKAESQRLDILNELKIANAQKTKV